jgi:ribonuclease HII
MNFFGNCLPSNYLGIDRPVGVDEAGRGSLAGPVVVACVLLKPSFTDIRIKDSKKLSAKLRSELYDLIIHNALAWTIRMCGPRRIEQVNILRATLQTMASAMRQLHSFFTEARSPKTYLIDGPYGANAGLYNVDEIPVINGDNLHEEIAAASILAKVTRDKIMVLCAEKYPIFKFDKHFGYGTALHRTKLLAYPATPIHRKTFNGVK